MINSKITSILVLLFLTTWAHSFEHSKYNFKVNSHMKVGKEKSSFVYQQKIDYPDEYQKIAPEIDDHDYMIFFKMATVLPIAVSKIQTSIFNNQEIIKKLIGVDQLENTDNDEWFSTKHIDSFILSFDFTFNYYHKVIFKNDTFSSIEQSDFLQNINQMDSYLKNEDVIIFQQFSNYSHIFTKTKGLHKFFDLGNQTSLMVTYLFIGVKQSTHNDYPFILERIVKNQIYNQMNSFKTTIPEILSIQNLQSLGFKREK